MGDSNRRSNKRHQMRMTNTCSEELYRKYTVKTLSQNDIHRLCEIVKKGKNQTADIDK